MLAATNVSLILAELLLTVWIALAAFLLVRLGVFSGNELRSAPLRRTGFNVLHFVGGFALYIGLLFAVAPLARGGVAAAHLPTTAPVGEGFSWPLRIADDLAKIITAIFLLVLARSEMQDGIAGLGLNMRRAPRGLALGLLALFMLMPLELLLQVGIRIVSDYLRHGAPLPVHRLLEEFSKPTAPLEMKVAIVFSAVVVAPLFEELLFRGVLQTALAQPRRLVESPAEPMATPRQGGVWYSRTATEPATSPLRQGVAILVASVVFTAVHWDSKTGNWEHFPVLMLLAVGLGYVYERTGNLWAPIAMHAAFNGLSLLFRALGK